jgi:hypothetical protein
MEFNLTQEQKIQSISSILTTYEVELYQSLLSAGYDPATFDESTYAIPEEAFPMSIFHKISTLLEKVNYLKQMLSEA